MTRRWTRRCRLRRPTPGPTRSGRSGGGGGGSGKDTRNPIADALILSASILGSMAAGVYSRPSTLASDRVTTNYGVLQFPGQYIGNYDLGDQLENFGTIFGDVQQLGGDDVLVNKGTISGDVDSGEGDDIVDNRGGTISGDVLLGDGNDRFEGSQGSVAGAIRGGDGNDTLNGGDTAEELFGDSGNDTLSGGAGDDTSGVARAMTRCMAATAKTSFSARPERIR